MMRLFTVSISLAALPLASSAGEAAVRLDVRPMASPEPALKYLLLPEVRELKPGNPAQYYLRCFMEQRNFFFTKGSISQRDRYLTMPLSQLVTEKVRNYGGGALYGKGPLNQVDWAARLNALDWEMVGRLETEGRELALPELGPLGLLGPNLQVRLRIEVAGRRYEEAVYTVKTMFALARHLGEYPAEAANHFGLAIAHRAVDSLEEMVQQPDAPNLYWALTDLPCPLVDMRKGLQGGSTLTATEFRPIREDAAMTEEELEKVVSRLSGLMGFDREQSGRTVHSLRSSLLNRVKDADRIHAIRQRLFATRRSILIGQPSNKQPAITMLKRALEITTIKDRIDRFPPLQVILLDEMRQFEIHRDERMKLLGLAPWQIDSLNNEYGKSKEDCLFADFLPDVGSARRAQARLGQRLALLRHVEAIRLHAAGHDGKLPEQLSEIAVPLPVDPFTGKSFVFQKEGANVHLQGCPPRRDDKNATYNVRYEIRIRK